RSFDELDWLSLLGVKRVALVLAPVIITELNEKKDKPNPRLRPRAASVLKKLEAVWSKGSNSEIRSGVELVLQAVEPSIDYTAHELDYRCRDDRLLASIIHFRTSNPGTPLLLVAEDFGLRVKARRHAIDTFCPSDDLKLPE